MSQNSLILVLLKKIEEPATDMTKIAIKSDQITPFGGIYYASKAFYALSLDKVINGTLGVRSSTYNGFQWDEIMSAMSDVFLCDGYCVEDVNRSEYESRNLSSTLPPYAPNGQGRQEDGG